MSRLLKFRFFQRRSPCFLLMAKGFASKCSKFFFESESFFGFPGSSSFGVFPVFRFAGCSLLNFQPFPGEFSGVGFVHIRGGILLPCVSDNQPWSVSTLP